MHVDRSTAISAARVGVYCALLFAYAVAAYYLSWAIANLLGASGFDAGVLFAALVILPADTVCRIARRLAGR